MEHVNAVELANELADADLFVLIDLAHALMLTAQGVFNREQGRTIVAALLTLLEEGPDRALAGDPAIGSITLQIERYLQQRCGAVGLDIQRARSRIDQNATGLRMADRKATLAVMDELVKLGEALLNAADRYDGVLAPGYTHLQHAQPRRSGTTSTPTTGPRHATSRASSKATSGSTNARWAGRPTAVPAGRSTAT